MPWKECHVMDERLRFVARLLYGEKMASLCAEFVKRLAHHTGRVPQLVDRSRVMRFEAKFFRIIVLASAPNRTL